MGLLWWVFKSTERLHWLTPAIFFKLPREKQIMVLVYTQERDMEELENAVARSVTSMLPVPVGSSRAGQPIGTRVE